MGMLFSQKRLVRRTTKDSLKSLKGNEGGITAMKKEKHKFNVLGKNKMRRFFYIYIFSNLYLEEF